MFASLEEEGSRLMVEGLARRVTVQCRNEGHSNDAGYKQCDRPEGSVVTEIAAGESSRCDRGAVSREGRTLGGEGSRSRAGLAG